MSVREYLNSPFYELQPYKSDPPQDALAFTGSPRMHPYDDGKIILLVEPNAGESAIYEFKAADIVGAASPATDAQWMWLFIDADQNPRTGWEGFEFIVNRTREAGQAWLERCTGGWALCCLISPVSGCLPGFCNSCSAWQMPVICVAGCSACLRVKQSTIPSSGPPCIGRCECRQAVARRLRVRRSGSRLITSWRECRCWSSACMPASGGA